MQKNLQTMRRQGSICKSFESIGETSLEEEYLSAATSSVRRQTDSPPSIPLLLPPVETNQEEAEREGTPNSDTLFSMMADLRADLKDRYRNRVNANSMNKNELSTAKMIDKYTKYLYELHMGKLREQTIITRQEHSRREAQLKKLYRIKQSSESSLEDKTKDKRNKKTIEEKKKLEALVQVSKSPKKKKKLTKSVTLNADALKALQMATFNGEEANSEDEFEQKTHRLRKLIERKQQQRKQKLAKENFRKAEEKRVAQLALLVRPGEGLVDWKTIVEVKRRK